MNHIYKTGLLIGVLVAIWTFVMGFTGWYKHPTLQALFWVVVVIQVVLLRSGLKPLAVEGRSFWSLVFDGTRMSIVASVVVFIGSMIFTTVAFPEYFSELGKAYEEMLRAQGKPPDEVKQMVEAAMAAQTPVAQASFGAIGTIVTGFLVSMLLAFFARGAVAARNSTT
jgi:hypothetical protein